MTDRKGKKQSDRQVIRWILQVTAREALGAALVVIVVELLLGVSGVWNALFLRGIVDTAVAGDRQGFPIAAARLAVLVLLQIAGRAVCRYLKELCRSTCENGLKAREYKWLMEKDYGAVTATHTGEWMNRLTSDTVVVADGVAEILPGIAFTGARLIGASVTLILLIPQVLALVLAGGIIVFFLSGHFRGLLKEMHKRIQEADGSLRVAMQEQLESMLVIRAFSREQAVQEQVGAKMARHKEARMRRNGLSNLFNIGYGLLMHGVYVAGGIYCGYSILVGRMTYGTFTAVLQLITQVQSPFANISGYLPRFYAMLASAERLQEAEGFADAYMAGAAEAATETAAAATTGAAGWDAPVEAAGGDAPENGQTATRRDFGVIGLSDISFSYRERGGEGAGTPVLEHFSCEIRRGEYIALIGPSGCGKSTVLKLLMCLYTPESGTRTIDGAPLEAHCRGLFAYVPQGNQLMSGTIREVLTFGDAGQMREDARLWEALRIACAEDFVREELPDGLDTVLGERGAGLSEGQMQRIAIARAVYSGYPVLLLDEATSALDGPTEKKVLENLRAMTDRTVLIVTHRPMALQMTDRVLDLGGQRRG